MRSPLRRQAYAQRNRDQQPAVAATATRGGMTWLPLTVAAVYKNEQLAGVGALSTVIVTEAAVGVVTL